MKIIKNYKEREPYFYGKAPYFSRKIKPIESETYKTIDKNSEEYIKYVYSYCRNLFTDAFEVNVETNRLQEIVSSNEPALFIMNHTKNQIKDVRAAKFFNTLLYREYLYSSKGATCPRSRVLANKSVLKNQPDNGEFYEWLGVRPLKVGFKSDKEFNRNILNTLIEEFINKKINLFLFPEGALTGIPFLPLGWKFQPGAASFVKKVLDVIDKIKVIPLAFAHSKKHTAIHIGEPVYFKKFEDSYISSSGNSQNKNFNKYLQKLFNDRENIFIKNDGVCVNSHEIVPYLSGLMMENLKACMKSAKEELKNIKPEVYDL